MGKYDRREFLQAGGIFLASTHRLFGFRDVAALPNDGGNADLREAQAPTAKPAGLFNTNLQTAIGLGDKTPGIVDGFGQLDSKNAKITWDIGAEVVKSSNTRLWQTDVEGYLPVARDLGGETSDSSRTRLSQTLAEGYLPFVKTEVKTANGIIRCSAYAMNTDCECFEIDGTAQRFRVQIWFPYARSVEVKDGIVTNNGRVLAVIPAHCAFETTEAKYNLLSPTRDSYSSPVLPEGRQKMTSDLDPALESIRASFLFRPLKYAFPAQPGETYHVYLGLMAPNTWKDPSAIVRLWVNDLEVTVNAADLFPGQPFLHEFITQASDGEIVIKSETDPSSPDPYRTTFLNAIWVFKHAVPLENVKSGTLNRDALFHVPCGEEPMHDVAASLKLSLTKTDTSKGPVRIYLPYDLNAKDSIQCKSFSADSALSDVKQRWDSLLSRGAEFVTGDERIDHLYKTSLINIFLLRAKYSGKARGGKDLFVVKPGATRYNAFWYRDGSYLTTALDVAGLLEEAERSLRLFWESGLPGNFASLGQQENGVWQAPINEFDGQGQALWALCHHFKFSGDDGWLKQVYPSIRKGALWIKEMTDGSKFVVENGERPIYYGLLPAGEGEDIGQGFNYYHDFLTIFGLRMAIDIAAFLGEESDFKWMKETYETYRANLLVSVKSAFERVGESKYIPATPYDPITKLEIWGSIAALYPTRFLKPTDPMMAATLEMIKTSCKEDEYAYVNRKKLWTYITPDWAMCYLLRGDLAMFHRLFDGYVAHASPTNAWPEEIFLDSRIGTGDMPHGWAAAQYVHIHRNAIVFEDEGVLHLCWGSKPAWVEKGIHVKNAPTEYGSINMDFKLSDGELSLDYNFLPKAKGAVAKEIRLHIPPLQVSTPTIRINGKVRPLGPDEHDLRLE